MSHPTVRAQASLLLGLTLSTAVYAQDPVLLRDFDSDPDDSVTSSVARQLTRDAGGRVFFFGWGADSRGWLYVTTDGTLATTTRLVGFPFSYTVPVTGEVTAFGDGVLFAANDGTHGMEPWYSDGTISGTYMLADLEPGSGSSDPSDFTPAGDAALFVARTTTNGRELFRTQGRFGDATLCRDVYPGRGDSGIGGLTAVGNRWFFHANGFPLGDEVWVSDGTPLGTIAVVDLVAGPNGSSPRDLARLGDRLVFTAAQPTLGRELWITDGTAAGTSLVTDLRPGLLGADPTGTVSAGDRVYFTADDGIAGREVWVSDGTAAGTQLFADVAPGGLPSQPESLRPTPDGRGLFFTALTNRYGREPWFSDGTAAGTVLLADVIPGTTGSAPALFAQTGGRLWFTASDPALGRELWSSDGTPGGTTVYADLRPGTASAEVDEATPLGDAGALLFAGDDGSNGREAWLIDGAGGAPARLDVRTRYRKTRSPFWNAIASTWSGTLLSDGRSGMWLSDGTPEGTRRIADLAVGAVLPARDGMFFTAFSSATGSEPWFSDGTTAGTRLLADLRSGAQSSTPGRFFELGDRVLFSANTSGFRSLYRSDGTTAGTVRLDEFRGPSTYSDSPADILRLGAEAYYITAPDNSPNYLYATDGTSTREVAALGDSRSGLVNWFAKAGNRLFFDVGGPTLGREPWTSDGTRAGTRRIRDLQPGSTGSDPQEFTALGDRIYFSAYRADIGRELWTSDGTDAGTRPVVDLWPGSRNSSPKHLTVLGDLLLFSAVTAEDGRELWATDGTEAGTFQVASFFPGTRWGDPGPFLLDGAGHALFAATEPATGRELWRTDGRMVERLTDLAPGQESSNPEPRSIEGNRVIFLADDGTTGREPWSLEIGATVVATVPACAAEGRQPTLRSAPPRPGRIALLEGDGATAGGWYVVALGLPASNPVLWPSTSTCRAAVDPSAATLLAGGTTTGSQWAAALVVPDLAALRGITVAVQAAVGPSDGPGGADWTQGLALTIGD